MAIDWDKAVLSPVMTVFGESMQYSPASGASYSISGVFDEAYKEVDPLGGTGLTSDQPVLGVRSAQFLLPPKRGDQITRLANGYVYQVKEVRPDGHGWLKLMLNEVSP